MPARLTLPAMSDPSSRMYAMLIPEEDEMTSTIVFMTSDQIANRRQELLDTVGLSLERLRELGEHYRLTPEQSTVLRELEKPEFLDGK